jgi:hypothetical protein
LNRFLPFALLFDAPLSFLRWHIYRLISSTLTALAFHYGSLYFLLPRKKQRFTLMTIKFSFHFRLAIIDI